MSLQVVLPPEEFAEDLDIRLGRANGNIYHRKPGVEGVHDGQVMVRLKKKRFVILDYSIVPNDNDIQAAQNTSHITIPPGAGKTSCTNTDCNKVGVPVLLYDSDPAEPPSLYMRSGLCFTCQRNLNEKRRTQRKRPSDANRAGMNHDASVFGSTSISKKFKLTPGSIVIHPVDGLRPHGDGYGFGEIGNDLQDILGDISNDTHRLLNAVNPHHHAPLSPSHHHPHHHHEHLPPPPPGPPPHHHHQEHPQQHPQEHPQHHHHHPGATDIAATAAAVAESGLAPVDDAATTAAMDAAHATSNGKSNEAVGVMPSTGEDINALYDKAFRSMNKGIYLLCQWKQSWDNAIAAAVAAETHDADQSLADAVASAAAVAAAASENNGGHVPSLLTGIPGTTDGKDDTEANSNTKDEDAAMIAAAEAAVADAAEVVVEAFEV